jgi:hypothetical protein
MAIYKIDDLVSLELENEEEVLFCNTERYEFTRINYPAQDMWLINVVVTNKRLAAVTRPDKLKFPYWKKAPAVESYYYSQIKDAGERHEGNYTQFYINGKNCAFQLVLKAKGKEFLKILGSGIFAGLGKTAADASKAQADLGVNRAYYQGKVDDGSMTLQKAQAAFDKEIAGINKMQEEAAKADGGALGSAAQELARMRNILLDFIRKGMELAKK